MILIATIGFARILGSLVPDKFLRFHPENERNTNFLIIFWNDNDSNLTLRKPGFVNASLPVKLLIFFQTFTLNEIVWTNLIQSNETPKIQLILL